MEEIFLKVYLQPKSSKNEIVGSYRDGIKVKITEPPIEGKANKGLIRFLAKELDIPTSHIEILKGHHSKEKMIRISGRSLRHSVLSKIEMESASPPNGKNV